MQKQLWAIAAILFSTALYIMGNGLIGVLIPVRANLVGFSNLTLGIIGSFYFVGFVTGCFVGPRLLARVGHSRTFGIGAGISAATILLQSMFVSEVLWIVLRGFFGVAAACIYMVIESWLNDRATNENRGRIFSSYLTVNFSAIIVGQMVFGTARPESFTQNNQTTENNTHNHKPKNQTQQPQPQTTQKPKQQPHKQNNNTPVGV